jgi:hypothetical protein
MSTQLDTVSGAYWSGIREHFFTAAEPEPEPEPGMSAEDLDDMGLDEYGERREALGIHTPANSDFFGTDNDQAASAMPDWRHPTYEEVVISAMDEYAAQRKELGVRDASAVFGASPAQPRVNASPWSIGNKE